MKNWIFLLIIFLIALIQASILNAIRIFDLKPDLLLVIVILGALFLDYRWALVSALFAGLLKDLFGFNIIGINSLLFCLWSILVLRISREIPAEENLVRFLIVLVVAILQSVIIRVIYYSLGNFVSLGIFIRITILGSLYTAAAMPVLFRLIKSTVAPLNKR